MSVAELHPEDLIDKEMLGELSADERGRLEAHLATCAPCRFERASRDDFRQEFEAEARRPPAEVSLSPAIRFPPPRPAMPRWVRAAVLLAAAFVAASAGAAVISTMRQRLASSTSRVEGEQEALRAVASHGHAGSEGSRAVAAHGATTAVAAESASEAALAPTSEATTAAPPETAPLAAAPSTVGRIPSPTLGPGARALPAAGVDPATSAAPAVPRELAAGRAPSPIASPPPPVAPTAAPTDGETPAASFARASQALRQGDYATATALFEGLEATFPGSAEARTSYAILGRLALDRGDASRALRGFDQYLRGGGGALTEEVLVGRAQALERLGRSSDEAAAWASLLAAFPHTSHAEHARSRLDALGAR